jgi:hypothetical protein
MNGTLQQIDSNGNVIDIRINYTGMFNEKKVWAASNS